MSRLVIEALHEAPVASRRVELVERKGIGHPDTICDSLVESIAVALARMYRERAGTILHYNVDKALLVAGRCDKGFGWGEMRRPIELIVGDRATVELDGMKLPVEETAQQAVDAWVSAHLPHVVAGRDLHVRSVLAPGSAELRRLFKPTEPGILANDTSGACGFAPLSPTEATVLAVERFLNGAEFKTAFPDTGQDVKVFGVRQDDALSLTVAMPLLARATASEHAYWTRRDDILGALIERFRDAPLEIAWHLNALDRRGAGVEGAYLTLTGTSAEDADSGQVGRGNQVNGLIAFSRPKGGEAAPGKNPVSHVGKIYSILAHRLARRVHAHCPDVSEVYVSLAGRIGEPVEQPWTSVQVVLGRGMVLSDVEPSIREVVTTELARMPTFLDELVRGQHPVV